MGEAVFDIEKLRDGALDQHGYVTAVRAAGIEMSAEKAAENINEWLREIERAGIE